MLHHYILSNDPKAEIYSFRSWLEPRGPQKRNFKDALDSAHKTWWLIDEAHMLYNDTATLVRFKNGAGKAARIALFYRYGGTKPGFFLPDDAPDEPLPNVWISNHARVSLLSTIETPGLLFN